MKDNSPDAYLERQLETWAVSSSGVELSPEVQRRVQELLAPSLIPVKPLPSEGRLALALFTVFAGCALMLMAIMDKAGFPLMTGTQMISMAAILTGCGIIFSLAIARCMVPGSGIDVPSLGVLLTLFALGVIGGLAFLFPWKIAGAFVAEGLPCAGLELMIAVPAAVVFWLLARRGALFADRDLGAALSGLAVVLALIVVQFRCMFQQAPHLLVWHAVTAAILIGLGTLIGQWQRHRWLS